MKKYFYWLAMMIVSAVALPACSDDDDDAPEDPSNGDNGVVVGEKKLVKIVQESEDNSWSETITFSYDNKGRLIEAKELNYDGGFHTYNFVWGNDEIKVAETSDSGSSYTHTIILKNGLVQSEFDNTGESFIYTYNSQNRLKEFSDGDSYICIWDGDKLESITGNYDETTYTYGKSCKNGYCPVIPISVFPGECSFLFVAHPELAGLKTSQCPAIETYSEADGGVEEYDSYEYEFDANGYISKVLHTYAYGDADKEKTIVTLTWQ